MSPYARATPSTAAPVALSSAPGPAATVRALSTRPPRNAVLFVTYVEGKDALFHLVLRRALGEWAADVPLELPVRGASVTVTAECVAGRLDFVSDFPEMEKALLAGEGVDPDEVEVIVGELYDVLARMRLGVEMIERSVEDLPEFAEVFGRVRCELFARYERYLRRRTDAGQLRIAQPEVMAHVIVDLCWWAAGRRRVSDPHAGGISDATARQTVCRFVADALACGADRRPEADRVLRL